MQSQSDIAENFLKLFDKDSYKKFEKGFFVNRPAFEGYYYTFKNMQNTKFCIILNTSGEKYPANVIKVDKYVFIVFNVSSLEQYLNEFLDLYFPTIIGAVDKYTKEESTRNLPYGYYRESDGTIKVDLTKANEVRRIYDMYLDTKSIRHIAGEMRTDFSHIRDILHDNMEYMQMTNKIVPTSKLKAVAEIMAQNIRGGAMRKKTTKDEIEEVRRMRKSKEKMQNLATQQ